MSCRHLDLRPLPRPFKGTEPRCRLADERANPESFVAVRELLARTGNSAGTTCPHADAGTFVVCPLYKAAAD